MSTERLRALRGATTVDRDEPAAILEATEELLTELIGRNGVAPDDIVSIVFTATPDVRAEFPARAARALGLSDVALLCAAEMDVPDALPRCIRVLLHVYTPAAPGELRHVYLREATSLRSDLEVPPPAEATGEDQP